MRSLMNSNTKQMVNNAFLALAIGMIFGASTVATAYTSSSSMSAKSANAKNAKNGVTVEIKSQAAFGEITSRPKNQKGKDVSYSGINMEFGIEKAFNDNFSLRADSSYAQHNTDFRGNGIDLSKSNTTGQGDTILSAIATKRNERSSYFASFGLGLGQPVEMEKNTDINNASGGNSINLGVGAQWDLVSVVIGAKALQQKWNEAQLNQGSSENTLVEPSTTTYTAYLEKPVNDGLSYGGAVDYINYDSALVKTKGSTTKSYIGTQSDWQYTAYTVFKNKGYNLSPSIAMVLKNDGALDDKSYFKLGFGAQIFY